MRKRKKEKERECVHMYVCVDEVAVGTSACSVGGCCSIDWPRGRKKGRKEGEREKEEEGRRREEKKGIGRKRWGSWQRLALLPAASVVAAATGGEGGVI